MNNIPFSPREKLFLAVISVQIAIIGWGISRKPSEVVRTETVEVVRTEYKDRIVYKDTRREERRPDGTVVVEETKSGEKDSSSSASSDKKAEIMVQKNSKSRYIVGYSVPLSLNLPTMQTNFLLGTVSAGVRLGDLPVFGVGSYGLKHSEFSLGVFVEF